MASLLLLSLDVARAGGSGTQTPTKGLRVHMWFENRNIRLSCSLAALLLVAGCGDDNAAEVLSPEADGGSDGDTRSNTSDASEPNGGPGQARSDAGSNVSGSDVQFIDVTLDPLAQDGGSVDASSASTEPSSEPPIDPSPTNSDDDGTAPISGSGVADTSDGEPTAAVASSSFATSDTSSTPDTSSDDVASEPQPDARLGCSGTLAPTLTVSGNLPGSNTWSGVVYVEDDVSLPNDASLTIEPGTRIVVNVDAYVDLGGVASDPTVTINGTEQEPVIICGIEPTPGYWRGLHLGPSVTTNSEIHHLRVFDGGGNGPAVVIESAVLVDELRVVGSADLGLRASKFGANSSGLSVYYSAGAVELSGTDAVTHFPLGGVFTGNIENLARLSFNRVLEDTTYHDVGIPYLQEVSTEVMEQAAVTFEAGVEYQFASDVEFEVGAFANIATWNVNGTAQAPVVFRGLVEQPGYWRGVIVGANVSSASSVEYLELRDGGGGSSYVLDVNAPMTVNNLTLVGNELGARIGETGLTDDCSNWTVSGSGAEPLTVHPNALTRIPTGGSYVGNDVERIVITTGTNVSAGDVLNHGLPYYVEADWDTRTGSDLTFTAGSQFQMGPDTNITFGAFGLAAAVSFQGTALEPVRFSAESVGFAGFWQGLTIGPNVQTGSLMTWTELSDAGGPEADAAALRIEKATFPVSNSAFTNFDNYGIFVSNANNDTNYESSGNTFTPGAGAVANVGSN